jgi:TonB-dependent SusC/RagA subfamily outer membrane receptor
MTFIILCKAVRKRRPAKSKTLLVMKLTATLLLLGCLHVTAAGIAQKVSITQENVPLKKVFAQIKKQTGYVFFYNSRTLENAKPVTVTARNMEMQEVLDQCFKDQPLTYRIVNKTIVVSLKPQVVTPAMALDTVPRALIIMGNIMDDSTNQPIAGANIVIKGVKGGVTSDRQGGFTVSAKRGDMLIISYVGYETQNIIVRGDALLRIRFKLNANKDPMDKVVVTGYQMLNKDNYTGNAVVVSGEELRKVNPVNIIQSIQAFDPSFRIAENNILGSNPNRLPMINLRGSTALPSGTGEVVSRANLQGNVNLPTFILDGYEVSLQKVYDLDNSRIQSITLLKDAAATAIYGSRAANGVVVITTKMPKPGKLQVFYNADLTLSGPDLTDYNLLNAEEKLEYERLAGLYEPVGSLSKDEQDVLFYQKKKNVVSGINTYWLSQPVRTALGQKHSLYLEGGTKDIRYGIDLRYQTQPGVMKGSTRDRYSIGMDLAYNPSSKFLFKNTLTVVQVNSKESPYGSFFDYVRMNPYYPKTDSLGRIIQSVDSWLIDTHQSGAAQFQTNTVLNPMYNSTLRSFDKNNYIELIDAFTGEWNIAYGLRLRGLMSITKRKYTYERFVSPLANQFYFYSTNDLDERGSFTYQGREELAFDGNMTLSYNRQLGDHFFNTTLGANIRTNADEYAGFTAIGFPNDRFTNVGFAQGYAEGASPSGYSVKERSAVTMPIKTSTSWTCLSAPTAPLSLVPIKKWRHSGR